LGQAVDLHLKREVQIMREEGKIYPDDSNLTAVFKCILVIRDHSIDIVLTEFFSL